MQLESGNLSRNAVTGDGVKAEHRPSPNFGDRRGTGRPSLIVLHYTGMATSEDALQRLCSPEFEVSAHYVIDETGQVFRLVDEHKRAWHAGAGEWAGRQDLNSRSIGIEIANPGNRPYFDAQMIAVESLLRHLMRKWRIPAHGVIGHSDLAPGRKFDPGPRFDWRRLALQGLSVWPEMRSGPPPDNRTFTSAAARFGYPAPGGNSEGDRFGSLLGAFRSRFRPWASGPLDRWDMGAMMSLADVCPCD